MSKITTGVCLSEELFKAIEEERGLASRSAWIEHALWHIIHHLHHRKNESVAAAKGEE